MKRVLTAVVLIPVVLAILFKSPGWFYSGFIGVVAVLAANEYFWIASHNHPNLQRYIVEVAIGFYFLGHVLRRIDAFGVPHFGIKFADLTFELTGYRILPLLLLAAGLMLRELGEALPSAAISYFGFLYIAVTLGEVSLIGRERNGRIMVFVFLVVVWSGDIFAYYIGRALGRNKLAPAISPGKTVEGALASLCGATLVSVLLFHFINGIGKSLVFLDALPSRSVMYSESGAAPPPILLAVAFGIAVNVAAQIGDLMESALKRGAGVKDSGTLLPGHGGVLDRIDAMLVAAPVLWFFWPVLYNAINHHP